MHGVTPAHSLVNCTCLARFQSGGDGDIQFAGANVVTAATQLTLLTTASIVRATTLTLVAGAGMVLHDDLTSSTSNSALVINADFDSAGDGTFSLASTKTITSSLLAFLTCTDGHALEHESFIPLLCACILSLQNICFKK